MSTNLRLVPHYDTPPARSVRALSPLGGGRAFTTELPPAYGKLALVLAAHAAVFGVLLTHAAIKPAEVPQMEPMTVSLVANPAPKPEPELVPVVPKPEPVVKKVTPKPKPVVEQPTPKPVTEAVAQPVAQPVVEAPTAPVVVQAPAPEPQPVVVAEPQREPVIEPPKFGASYLSNPPPQYPNLSRRSGEEGRVLLRVLVSVEGGAESVQLEQGSGYTRLDHAAIAAVKGWRFIPAKRDNQPISAYVLVPVNFSLQS